VASPQEALSFVRLIIGPRDQILPYSSRFVTVSFGYGNRFMTGALVHIDKSLTVEEKISQI
jgi:hypothetical protein